MSGEENVDAEDDNDYYPTPEWATRALFEYVLDVKGGTCLEPACGEGHMAEVCKEYFDDVTASDLINRGYGNVGVDFLGGAYDKKSFGWTITNPPFKYARRFVLEGLRVSRVGVAMLLRTNFVEGVGNYNHLFRDRPPHILAPFTRRVNLYRGEIREEAKSAVSMSWYVWFANQPPLSARPYNSRVIRKSTRGCPAATLLSLIPPSAKASLARKAEADEAKNSFEPTPALFRETK